MGPAGGGSPGGRPGGGPRPRGAGPGTPPARGGGPPGALLGADPPVAALRGPIARAARDREPVLLWGEASTGKGMVARTLHARGGTAAGAFVPFHCAGWGKRREKGQGGLARAFRAASGGTLYLEGLEGLDPQGQRELLGELRALEEGESGRGRARLMAALLAEPGDAVARGRLARELGEVLGRHILHLPALQERRGDIPLLAERMLTEELTARGLPPKRLDAEAQAALAAFGWPGNLAELRALLVRLAEEVSAPRIGAEHLPPHLREGALTSAGVPEEGDSSLREARRAWERKFLAYHLARNEWDVEAVARRLQLKPAALQRKLRTLGLAPQRARRPRSLPQRTLRRSVVLCGQGLHSGLKTGLILQPLPPGSGIQFGKITLEGTVPALVDFVESTDYATTIRNGPVVARTIEHLMAVLHAYGISNLLVKVSDEVPIMDGSALDFCQIIEGGGLEEQDEPAGEFVVERPYVVGEEGSEEGFLRLEPAEGFSITYTLDYPPPIGRQVFEYVHSGPETFKREVAPARTFGFLREVEQLERLGLASGGRLDNLILVDDEKVINTELRFPDEFARHKVLDLMGDLYLLGRPIRGRVVAEKTGHSDNVALLRSLAHAARA
ncbi:MAG: UDP-3-O-acyl-N-acetylglucosamine deacetylase [Nitrospinota bacterium]